ncbi:hypothetical protein [Clostridium sp. YIM B02569]|uniref:hypothetical protein n=1 Tax=Clostridium sp. YIM B02569 TaxID=2911967 RepID=UPI001EEA955F|nr:hypothetical protein [Clostridium sp. YIM B02569]
MKKLAFVLFLCFMLICGCTNILQAKAEKENADQEISISNNNEWPTFTDKDVEEAKEVAKEYYKHIKLPHDIENINYSMSNDEKDEIYKAFIGRDTSKYRNSNSIFFLVATKDEDGCKQSRFILLTRENKDSNWKVVNEGL